MPFAQGGLPQGEWRARFEGARRRLASLAAAARTERGGATTTAASAQAELERKARERAGRWAAAEVRRERQRLLRHLLAVADNLERALAHAGPVEAIFGA